MFSFLYHCLDVYQTWLYIWVTRRVSYKMHELLLPFVNTWVHPWLFGGSFLLIFLVIWVVLLCVFRFWVPCCDVRYDVHMITMFGSSLTPIVCLSYVICVSLRIVVSNTYCFVVFFLRLVHPMLTVSLDCPFAIVPSVFSTICMASDYSLGIF